MLTARQDGVIDQELLWVDCVSVGETKTRNANNDIYYQLQQDSLFGPHATSPDKLLHTDHRVNQTFQMISILI